LLLVVTCPYYRRNYVWGSGRSLLHKVTMVILDLHLAATSTW